MRYILHAICLSCHTDMNLHFLYPEVYSLHLWCESHGEKKTIEPCPNTIDNVMDLMVIMGIVLVLMETIMCLLVCDVFYWWDVKSYWKNPQITLQKGILKMVLLEKANG